MEKGSKKEGRLCMLIFVVTSQIVFAKVIRGEEATDWEIKDCGDYLHLKLVGSRVHSVKHLLDCLLLAIALYRQVCDIILF